MKLFLIRAVKDAVAVREYCAERVCFEQEWYDVAIS